MNRTNHETGGWPFAAGEMACRVRAHDWAATALGPVERWPANLRVTVQLLLEHPFASIVLWGPDLIQIYNDRYRELMGAKHPAGLGQPTRECWPEIWHINAPIYERVWNGESVSFDEAHYPIRRFGVVEDAWFTLSYSPVRDKVGAVAGVFMTILESTRRVCAERALRQSDAQVRHTAELLEQLIESAPDPIWTKDLDSRWVVVNSAAAAVIGRPRNGLIGRHIHDALPAGFADVVAAEDQRILQEGVILRGEEILFDASRGEPRIFLSIRAPLRAADGRITGLLGIARDITERKAAEARLAELNATLEEQVRERTHALQHLAERERAILASAASAIIATDLDGRIIVFNPAAEALFHLPVAQALSRPMLNLYDPEDLQAHLGDFPPEVLQVVLPEAVTQVQGSPGAQRSEWRYMRADGTCFPGLLSVSLLRNAQGSPMGLLSVITDLTERKAMEGALRQRTAELESITARERAIFTSAASGFMITDLANNIIALNPAAERMLGISEVQALGRPVLSFHDPDEVRERLHVIPLEVRRMSTGLSEVLPDDKKEAELQDPTVGQQTEWTFVRADGRRFPALLNMSVLRDTQGAPLGFLGIVVDLTERKAMEEALRQRTAELEMLSTREKAIVTSAGIAVITTDLEGRITSFNPAAETMFRASASQAVGHLVTEFCEPEELTYKAQFFPPDVQAEAARMPAALIAGMLPERARPGEGPRNEWTYMRGDGTSFPGLLNLSVLRDANGQALGFLVLITDLTQRKALEEQLRERTRQAEAATAAKSAFLAHMSHEIRTPLNAVIGLSQLLAPTTLDERQRMFVNHINAAGEHLLALVNDVLDVSKIEAGEMRLEWSPFDLPALLQQARAIVEMQAAQKRLHLEFELDPALPQRLLGDATRLKQILTNLLGNAVKFTDVGSVTLRATQLVLQERARDDPRPPLSTLRIEVSDTGIGIPREKQAAIFQPFTQADATTTRRFGGTGLGLSIVQHLVGMMDGCLDVKSEPGKGSAFGLTVTLPVAR